MSYTVTPKNALNTGNAHSAFAFHVYGMPYCLCSNQAMADSINGDPVLKLQIFGSNIRDNELVPLFHCNRGFAIPNAIRMPSSQTISLNDTMSLPEGGDWNLEVYDKDYGIDWTAAPWYFPSGYNGLPGIQFLAEAGDGLCVAKELRSSPRKSDTSFYISDPEGDYYDMIETQSRDRYSWIGSECVYLSYVDLPLYDENRVYTNEQDVDARGRGIFRSPDSTHTGDKYLQSEILSNVPLGSIAGKGCALWMLTYSDTGDDAVFVRKIRHGKVKTTSNYKNGSYKISVGNWTDWLKNTGKVDRLDLMPKKFIFTRGTEPNDATSTTGGVVRKTDSWRAPHLGIVQYTWYPVDGAFRQKYWDMWLCDKWDPGEAGHGYVVFDTWQDVIWAVVDELEKCYQGTSTLNPGISMIDWGPEDPDNKGHYWGEYQRPVLNSQGYLDVELVDATKTGYYLYKFYGVLPWIFGLGSYKPQDRDVISSMINGLWIENREYGFDSQMSGTGGMGVNMKIPYIYPWSAIRDGETSLMNSDYDSDQPSPVEACDWNCQFYWDASQNMNTRQFPDFNPANYIAGSPGFNYPKSIWPTYSFPLPNNSAGSSHIIYVEGDPTKLRTNELIQVDNMSTVKNNEEKRRWSLVGTVSGEPSYDSETNTGAITLISGPYSSIYTECEFGAGGLSMGERKPALITKQFYFPNNTSYWKNVKYEKPFNNYSALFYVPEFHDEYYGGCPIVIRTNGGGYYGPRKCGDAFKSLFTTPSDINSLSRLDYIPDISGDTDHPSTIDFASMNSAFNTSITGHTYNLDFSGDFDILDAISN
jgi:hypothetical protein